ncbi:hypothetical protein L5515_018054 [Caenorhabditis briggsae]|uniref:Uncharacterized protein n=1 Tax=Caenorhabditis briggsae TaxID=6238 RepID=A0AAE9FH18_CAEBR|nr:hypothetical protein L5515_018054 [Caenorhabditis briggsae]
MIAHMDLYHRNCEWQLLDIPESFKEVPGYQMWKDHYRNVRVNLYPYSTLQSFDWIKQYLVAASKDARNAEDVKRYRTRAFGSREKTIPSRGSAFKLIKVKRNFNSKLRIEHNHMWTRPPHRLLTWFNGAIKLEQDPDGTKNYQEQIQNWLSQHTLNSGNLVASAEELAKDLEAFRSLVFMRIGKWNPVADEFMLTACRYLRFNCNGCPIEKLFNQVAPNSPLQSTVLQPDDLEKGTVIQVEMLRNVLMVDYTIYYVVVKHMRDLEDYFVQEIRNAPSQQDIAKLFASVEDN